MTRISGAPARPRHDAIVAHQDTIQRSRDELRPSFATAVTLKVATNARRLRGEGAGNAGCFTHPQPRMQMKQAYELVTTGSPKLLRHSLRDGFTTYSTLSPAIGRFCHRRQRNAKHCRQLHASVEASRPRGFVVRRQRIRLVHHPRPSHPAPSVRDDRDTPLLWAQDGRDSADDLGR